MINYIQTMDFEILEWIRILLKSGLLDSAMPVVTYIGNKGMAWVITALILMSTKKYKRHGAVLALTLLTGFILGDGILKNIFQRPRPFEAVDGIQLLIKPPGTYSFPSGHTTSSFGAFWAIHKKFKNGKISALAFSVAALISFSRMYLFVHYPSDILGGIILGISSASAVLEGEKIFDRKQEKNKDGQKNNG